MIWADSSTRLAPRWITRDQHRILQCNIGLSVTDKHEDRATPRGKGSGPELRPSTRCRSANEPGGFGASAVVARVGFGVPPVNL